ncbi:MAG: tetratricopeptide repeat protein [Thermostichales cyanobacterium SZTDM-1c_bins_54]
MSRDPYKYDLFLRYHRAQARWAKQLAERLDREGFRVWFDQWMLEPGDDRRVELRRAIDECRWIALVLSPQFVANPWPKDELYCGFAHAPKAQNQRLLPLIYEDCELPAPVRDLDWFDFRGSEDDPILFEFQALQLMAFLDPSITAPRDLQRFRLHFQRSQSIPDEQVSGWQALVRSFQALIYNLSGGGSRSLSQEERQQVFFLQWLQRLFQWNTADLQFDRGEQFWSQGNWTEALNAYDRALNIDPNFALAWARRGDVLVKLGRYGEAINSYNGSLSLDPYNEGVRLRLALIQGRLKRYKAAVISYDKVLELDPDNAVVWHNRALRLAQLGRPTLALKSVDTALDYQPDLWKSWLLKAYLLHHLKRSAAAIPWMQRALKGRIRRSQQARLWRHYGLMLAAAQRPQLALASFSRSLKWDPEQPHTWHNRGLMLLRLQRYRAATQAFDQAYQRDPDNPKTWHARGYAFQCLGFWQEAVIHYEEALKLRGDYFPARYALAVALLHLGRAQQALPQFSRILQRKPRLLAAQYGQIQCWRQLQDYKAAAQAARQLTETYPGDPWGWFALGMIAADQQDWENAILYFSQVLSLNPRDSSAYNNRAWCLAHVGRYPEALQDIQQALDLAPQAIYLHTLGVIQQRQGDLSAAQATWQQALARDPHCQPAREALGSLSLGQTP